MRHDALHFSFTARWISLCLCITSLLAMSLSPPQADTIEIIRDDFNTTVLDPSWHWIREDVTHWSLSTVPGRLQMITQPKDIWQSNNTAPLLVRSSPSPNFVIDTNVTMTPTADHHQGGLIVYADDDNYVRLTYVYLSGNGPSFEFAQEIGGVFTSIQSPAPEGNSFYLRIQKLDSTYYGYYSQDGIRWTPLGKHTNVPFILQAVGISAFNAVNVTTIEIPVDFDFFQIRAVEIKRVYLPLIQAH